MHDSIVDARMALMLYKVYKYIVATRGPHYFMQVVHNIYQYGGECGWTVTNLYDEETLYNFIFPSPEDTTTSVK